MPSNIKYVLWVRHCYACHNDEKGSLGKWIPGTESNRRAYKVDSYCTKELGEKQAFEFGKRYLNILSKLNEKLHNLPESNLEVPNEVKLYSSALPRAMETAKLISGGMIETLSKLNLSDLFDEDDKDDLEKIIQENVPGVGSSMQEGGSNTIKRIDHIQEINDGAGDNVNAITKKKSDEALCNLNKLFSTPDYYEISKTILSNNDNPTNFSTRQKEAKNKYNEFKKHILPKLNSDKLNIIVSHSSFLQQALGFSEKNKMENLDAYLIVYEDKNYNSSDRDSIDTLLTLEGEPRLTTGSSSDSRDSFDSLILDGGNPELENNYEEKYRILYLFAQDKINEDPYNPPNRKENKKYLKSLNENLKTDEQPKRSLENKYTEPIGTCSVNDICVPECNKDDEKCDKEEKIKEKELQSKLAYATYRGGKKSKKRNKKKRKKFTNKKSKKNNKKNNKKKTKKNNKKKTKKYR
jgi:hypothetical protein